MVSLESGGGAVRKTFIGPDPDALIVLATREHDRLSRFSAALDQVRGARCPMSLGVSGGPHPSVRMTRAHGLPLAERLGRPFDQQEIEWLTRVLSDGLSAYVETFDEPYYDFHFRNMLYDVRGPEISFLDFGVPDHLVSVKSELDRLPPFDVSLGNLYGSSLFEAVRPRNLHRARQNRSTVRLSCSVVETLLDGRHSRPAAMPPTREGLRQATKIVYEQSASWGPRSHHLWYWLFPRQLVRGQRRLDELFAEPPLNKHLPTAE